MNSDLFFQINIPYKVLINKIFKMVGQKYLMFFNNFVH